MITIRILNARQIVEKEKGKLVSRIAPYFVDLETRVEEEIAEQLKKVFEERNIRAEILITREP
jgi:hypothetical protein